MTDGLLLLNKPEGMTSHDVVGFCRKTFSRRDIGHAGTLDPMATGLLVLLIGKTTKLSDYILSGDKTYEAVVELGRVTDTDDVTGQNISYQEQLQIDVDALKSHVQNLSGVIHLPVPIYSAIKVKGKKLYQKARQGESFEPPMREMEFKNVQYLGLNNRMVQVSFSCRKGGYVRSWAKELGKQLGCGATLAKLTRTGSAPYSLTEALPFQDLKSDNLAQIQSSKSWVDLNKTLPSWPTVKIAGLDEKLIINGQISRKLERFLELEYGDLKGLQGIKVLSRRSNQLISLLSHEPPLNFKIRRVFPISD